MADEKKSAPKRKKTVEIEPEHEFLTGGGGTADKQMREYYKEVFEAEGLSDKEEQIINGNFDDEITDSSKSVHISDNADEILTLQGGIDDMFETFKEAGGNVDLTVDTTGRMKIMNAEEREEKTGKNKATLATVEKWLDKIICNEEYSPEEESLIEKCKTIAEMF